MRRDAAALAACVAAVFTVLTVADARAGTYDVVSCGAAATENLAWAFESSAPDAFAVGYGPRTCSPLYGVSLATLIDPHILRAGDFAAWTFRAPAGTLVRGVQVWRHTATQPAADGSVWRVTARAGATPILAEDCRGSCLKGPGAFDAGSSVSYAIGAPTVRWGVECESATCTTGNGTGNYAGVDLHAARVTVDDPVAPSVETVGELMRPGAATVAAGDSAGIRSLRAAVDGTERVSLEPGCDFRLAAPCPARAEGSLGALAEGRHTVSVSAEDAAGNPSALERTVVVDGTPPVLERVTVSGRTVTAVVSDALSGVASGSLAVRNGRSAAFTELPTTVRDGRLVATIPRPLSPSRVGLRLTATDGAGNAVSGVISSMSLSTRVGARARAVRNARASVPYGRAVTVSGRLTTIDGAPLAGQEVSVTSQIRSTGSTPVAFTSARTDARGRFSLAVPAGPSRLLRVVYGGDSGVVGRTRSVSLRVAASATINASSRVLRGSGTIRFSGRLRTLGTKLPPGGKIVDLQASAGGRWSTVDTTRAAGRGGRWHAVARFRGTPGRYPVRLRIRREAAFGYDLGYSRAVVVTVR